jgi:hypothetical protein
MVEIVAMPQCDFRKVSHSSLSTQERTLDR